MEFIDLLKQDAAQDTRERENFLMEIVAGLSKKNKQLPSKYFYDEHGSQLFNKITRHPDYYLTNCEIAILQDARHHFLDLVRDIDFNLVELGPGDGNKAQILLQSFLQNCMNVHYVPIDISMKYLKLIAQNFKDITPTLPITAIHTEYLSGLKWLAKNSHKRNFILFLGSSIGNYNLETAHRFMHELRESVNKGDYFLIGFDLRKDIRMLMKAYDDDAGITREFNFNLLKRINRELHANFEIEKFYHHAIYNVYSGAMESYLVSTHKQCVKVNAADKEFEFEHYEPIHVEYSYKYLFSQINELANKNGFKLLHHFTDKKEYFVDSLWQAV